MSEMTAEELIMRLGHLKGRRVNFDTQWQEVKDLTWPDAPDFITERSPGEKTNLEIYDMTTALALEQGAAALETFLTPRTQRWHKLRSTNEELNKLDAVKTFFEKATDVLFQFRNSPRARFASQMHEGWKSSLAYGNNCIQVIDVPSGGTGYRYTHIGATWIDVDPDGVVDTIFHEYKLTAKAAVQRWKDDAPKCAHDALKSSPYSEHTYLHAVMPNPDYEPGRASQKQMAFRAYEVSCDDKKILEEGGYHELPYMWSRYTVNPAEVYGRGPAMLILPDIKTLQAMERVFLRSGQKVADPPLLVANDGVLGRGNKRINTAANRLIMGGLSPTGQALIAPLQTGARLDVTMEMANGRRELIRKAFFLDVFEILVMDRVEMTATEALQRAREKGQLIAPIIGRQQSEMLGPMIERELKIAQRQGKLPPLPPELQEAEGEYEIEYESDATRMQKAEEVAAFPKTFEAIGPLIQVNPSLLEVFNAPDAIRRVFEISGGSTQLLRSAKEYEEIQEQAAKAQQEAAAMEQAPGAAKALRDVASASREVRAA